MWKRIACATLIGIGLAANGFAQNVFDFGSIPGVPAQPNVEVDLDSTMLAFVTRATQTSGPGGEAAAKALAGLKHVRVRVYEQLTDPAAVVTFVDKNSLALEQAGWHRVVYVADEGDNVRIYARTRGQQISGMTVMVVDDEEAVFMNIDGAIDPAQLGFLARAMGMGGVLGPLAAAASEAGAAADGRSAPASGGGPGAANGGAHAGENPQRGRTPDRDAHSDRRQDAQRGPADAAR